MSKVVAASTHTYPFEVGSLGFPATPTSPLGSLLLSLSTRVLIARCGDRDPFPSELLPTPFGPTDRVARRDDLLVELERCGLEEDPPAVDMLADRREIKLRALEVESGGGS